MVNSSTKKDGGPLWARTTDLSLIRSEASSENKIRSANPLDHLDDWINELKLKGTARVTYDAYLGKVRSLLDEYPRPTIPEIKEYLIKKQQAGYLSGTIANYVKAFRSFFGYLYSNGLYDLDYQRLKIPRIKYRERRVPADDDVRKLLQTADNEVDRLILLLLVDCGLRVTELATIKLKNINLEDLSILINGKGGKTRTVYLSETSVKHLDEYIAKLKGEYLFPVNRSDADKEHRSRRYFEDRLDELCKRAGVERITPHQLRHYFATHTLSNGADVKAISEMLGHADVGITLKIYHHVNAKSIMRMHQVYSPLNELKQISRI